MRQWVRAQFPESLVLVARNLRREIRATALESFPSDACVKPDHAHMADRARMGSVESGFTNVCVPLVMPSGGMA